MAINKRIIRSNDEAAGGASFNTVLYNGNDSVQSVTGVGFNPDWVWLMGRNVARNYMYAELNGNIEYGVSSNTDPWEDAGNALTSFDSDGFTLGDNFGSNEGGINYVAWCWKAGGAAVTNTDGTITSQVSANTEAGFSIVTYTGDGANGTVGHGLGVTPNIVLTKRRNSTSNWSFNGNIGGLIYGTNKLSLNDTAAIGADTNEVLAANSNNFTAGTSGSVGASGGTYVAYCFAEVAGFSKFGSYTGTETTNNPTIDCGFEPAFVMIKCKSEAMNWAIFDNKRDTINPNEAILYPNLNLAETNSSSTGINFLSNGFQINSNLGGWINTSGANFIYMAFANQF